VIKIGIIGVRGLIGSRVFGSTDRLASRSFSVFPRLGVISVTVMTSSSA
jgi:hypothetical protein